MGSRYEGEKAISLDTSPPRPPSPCPNVFFRGSGAPHGTQARLLLTVSDGSSRRPAHPRSFPAIPIPGHGVPYAPGSRTHDAYGCPWAPSRAASLPAVARGLFPAIAPLPSPSLPAIGYCRDQRPGLSFRGAHQQRLSPFPQKQKAEPPRRAAPLHSGKTEPETTGVRPPDGPSRRSPPGCSRLP